jgi:hypothetical protein
MVIKLANYYGLRVTQNKRLTDPYGLDFSIIISSPLYKKIDHRELRTRNLITEIFFIKSMNYVKTRGTHNGEIFQIEIFIFLNIFDFKDIIL